VGAAQQSAQRGRRQPGRLVLIGNGMAGMRTVEEILARAPGRFAITVFGAEPHVNYDRIMLSPMLAGEKSFDEIVIHDRDWYAARDVELLAGERAVGVDRMARRVRGANGAVRSYDLLIVATGSNPIVIPVSGTGLPGVVTFRDATDVDAMLEAAGRYRNAVVIGGGLLGLEAANGLRANGMEVTVVHLMPTLMERQLDPSAAHLLQKDLERRGIRVLTRADTKAILGEDRVRAVLLEDGTEIPADLVVMAVGIRPNTDLARAIGLECRRGVVVDDAMRTSDPCISAVGECAEHRGVTYGLVAPLWEMARVCADRIAGIADSRYEGAVLATRLKVTGIDMFSAGDFLGGEDTEDILYRDAAHGVYKRLVVKEDRIRGAVLYGDARDGGWYFRMLRDGTDITAQRDALIFGPAYVS
jgi:nitrite reductase (NADH) large subunit